VLSRRIGGLDGREIRTSLIKMHASAIPGMIFAIAVSLMVDVILPAGTLNGLVTVVLAGCGSLLLYVLFAKAFGVTELEDLTGSVKARFGR
jgi:putative peptidoglycan lipid II flippase